MRRLFLALALLALPTSLITSAEQSVAERAFTERVAKIIEKGSLDALTTSLEDGRLQGFSCAPGELLRLACIHNRPDVVNVALERGADLNVGDREGDLPVDLTIRCGHFGLTEHLAHHGAQLSAPAAAVTGAVPRLGELVTADPDLLDRTWRYHPFSANLGLLHFAALAGQPNSIRALVQLGADPEVDDTYGFSALYRAAQQGHLDAVRELLKHDKRIDHASQYGWTPLIGAACNGHDGMVAFLLQQDAQYDIFTAITRSDLPQVQECVVTTPGLLQKEVGQLRPLGWAAQHGRTEIAAWLLDRGAETDWRAKYSEDSPLQLAAWRGHADTVRLLIEKGANLNIGADKDAYGTALHRAAWQNHEAIAKMLLKAGADIEAGDNTAETPLAFAAKREHTAMVRLLLDAGAQVDGKGEYTPLRTAVWDGRVEMARLLLDHGADVNRARTDDGSALYVAAERGHVDMIKLLLEHNPDFARQDPSALNVAAQCQIAEHYRDYFEIVSRLLKAGSPIDARWRGFTLLHFARDPGMIAHLVKAGADVNARGPNGRTPLHLVFSRAQAKALLDAGADINAVDANGETPLHNAIDLSCYTWTLPIRDLLLERGAKVDPFAAARLGRSDDVLRAIKQDPALAQHAGPGGRYLLIDAAAHGDLTLVKELIRLGADVTKQDGYWMPLHQAAAHGHAEVAEFLIQHGADVNATCGAQKRPLYCAAWSGHAHLVRLLIKYGADLEAQTENGCTALMAAAEEGHLEAARALMDAGAAGCTDAFRKALDGDHDDVTLYLLSKGADPKGVPLEYSPPLHRAAASRSPEVVRALVKAGADVNAANERGETALDWAMSNGKYEAARALRQLGGLQAYQLVQLRNGQVTKLIQRLDDERFAVRQRAYRELRRFGGVIADLLRKAREETESQQVRTQLDSLLRGPAGE